MDLGATVVADEQPLELVQPGEGALDHPTGTAEAGAVLGLAAGDLRFDPAAAKLVPVRIVVIAAVGRDPVGPPSWPADLAATGGIRSRSGISWVTSFRLPPVSVQASGIPVASTTRWCFDPFLARSTGLGPVADPLLSPARDWSRRPRATIRSRQSHAARKHEAVQPLPDACPLPLVQAAIASRAAAEAELQRQMPPRDPGVQHEQDPLQRLPIRQPFATRIAEPPLQPAATAARSAPTTRQTRSTAQRPSTPLPLDDGCRWRSSPVSGSLHFDLSS